MPVRACVHVCVCTGACMNRRRLTGLCKYVLMDTNARACLGIKNNQQNS